jgi:outer membrane protein OmpA-like peptidoglycan-associated protein
MKKLVLILSLLMFVSANNIFAQKKRPQIKFDSKEFDYGKLKEEEGPKSGKFYFTNTGTDTLKIIGVKPGCGCTTANYTKTPIKPGKRGEIEATYDPKNRPGPFSKSITVTTNDSSQLSIQLVIKGEVLPKPKTFVDNFPVKLGNLRFNSSQVNFQNIFNTEIKSDTIKLYNEWKQPMTIGFKDFPSNITLKAIPESIKPGKEGKIIVTYDATKRNDFGFLYDKFMVVTNDSMQPEKGFTVTANVSEDFSKLTPEQLANAPVIKFDTIIYDFGTIKEGDKADYSYVFKNEGKNDLVIRKTKASCGCTASNPEKSTLKNGESSKINVSFNSSGKVGQQSKTITVTCNDPKKSTVILTIKGLVVKKDEQAMDQPKQQTKQEPKQEPLVASEKIEFKNIFFDFGKSDFKPESEVELQNVIDLLNKKPQLKVEISGYSDNKGLVNANQKMSEKRAKAVYNYLINKGINKARLSYKGFGASKPIGTNDNEEGRAKNRRTEIKIIEN